jgi:hypothetical protein
MIGRRQSVVRAWRMVSRICAARSMMFFTPRLELWGGLGTWTMTQGLWRSVSCLICLRMLRTKENAGYLWWEESCFQDWDAVDACLIQN